MGSCVEHLEGVNGKSLPTGITNCRSKHATEEYTRGEWNVDVAVVTTPEGGGSVDEDEGRGGDEDGSVRAETKMAPSG
jgi:hypothetical protein